MASEPMHPTGKRGDNSDQILDQFFFQRKVGFLVDNTYVRAMTGEIGAQVVKAEAGQAIGIGEEDFGDFALFNQGTELFEPGTVGIESTTDIREDIGGGDLFTGAVVLGGGDLAVEIALGFLVMGGDAAVDGGGIVGKGAGGGVKGVSTQPFDLQNGNAAMPASSPCAGELPRVIPPPKGLRTHAKERSLLSNAENCFHREFRSRETYIRRNVIPESNLVLDFRNCFETHL